MKITFSWNRLFVHWQKDVKLWLILLGLFTLTRVVLLIAFRDHIADASVGWDIFSCLRMGAKFDCRDALFLVALLLILSTFASLSEGLSRSLDTFRLWWAWFTISLTIFVAVIDVGFFAEYHDQFNQWILGLFFDDIRSITLTIWNGYPVIWLLMGFFVVSFSLFLILRRYLNQAFFNFTSINNASSSRFLKIGLVVLMVFLIKCALTLTLDFYFLETRSMSVTGDRFLNGIVGNPYYAIYKTMRDYKKRMGVSGVTTFISDGDLKSALLKIYPDGPEDSNNIEDWIRRSAKGSPLAKKPEHIFLIVMESQDNWLLQDNYSDFPLSSNLRWLKKEGLYVGSFLPAGFQTVPALECIILGMPDVGISSYYQPLGRQPFSSSIAKQFKELGYTTNFFYGGFLNWSRIGEIASNQGFENVYGCPCMASRSMYSSWGISDELLFKFVEEKAKSFNGPTFNLIMTTSNHDPHEVALEEEGCPIIEIEEVLRNRGCTGTSSSKILGHYWYADKCVGDFVREVSKNYALPLFAITGDHWGRFFIDSQLPTFECRSVPFILYGPEILKGITFPESVAGGHIDIAPTLVELVAPKGYQYWSLGSNLMASDSRHIGIGARSVIFKDCIFDVTNCDGCLEPLPGCDSVTERSSKEIVDLYNAFHAVGWWRLMKGSEIK